MLGVAKKQLPIIEKAIHVCNSTPQTDQDDTGWSLGEMVMDERLKSAEDEMVENDTLTQVRKMLAGMDAREATVLRMRFGLDDGQPHTLDQIGRAFKLSRERVRQIEREVMSKLRVGERADKLRAYAS